MSAISWAESSARQRIQRLLDPHSFHEWLPPEERLTSPHLAQLGVPAAFDDGVAIGRGQLDGKTVFIAAQEGEFMGGGVGEIHGAKLVGLLKRAELDRPEAVLLLVDSGGVRLHEANAGLIAVSEVMRAVLDTRASGVPVIVLIGSRNGCFGGMGIVVRCADHIIMSDIGRLAMSGPEVIEASHGVEEFDSRDRALVWRTTGGKHRWLCGDCDQLVEDGVGPFRAATLKAMAALPRSCPTTFASLQAEHALLSARQAQAPADGEAISLWSSMGLPNADRIPDLSVHEVLTLRARTIPLLETST
ncbi:biotin-independent malonate decarboxylase subunit beta [Hydrogenophaga sp. PAMC20947]|uniref:biotin-independent malonate decarboxylase subunit beta n=1 Tax=Hydrogenophaga sp. PAMC20947 TaxID=2565558 RepID=UPI00109E2078|nr:biotin-independent malonate decarboxylase subunit beta [Hydrogenophaga sp. PAMC20947]QCB46868.1 biotin-independent malonate decarboxylase subunit beta [Hydrogenophaga sp. PAMC20947]